MIKEELSVDIQTIDAALLSKMFLAGAKNLEAKKEWINELNVFPVPDGDTGTNMSMTIISAAKEVAAVEKPVMKDLAKAISSGSLRGARGNSGVILSQLLRGFTKTIKHYDQIDKIVLCESFQKACETAYKAVMKPKEGTILTVAKGAAEKALELSCDDSYNMEQYIAAIIAEAERVLALTPEMLPVLKQAGVVDSGGQGLVEVLKGAQDAFLGTLTEAQEDEYRAFLQSMGDSIVLVADEEIVKTHVHTNDPGLVLQKALTFGSLSRIKIDNMREEHQEKLIKDAEKLAKEQEKEAEGKAKAAVGPKKDMGFIAVSIGEGVNEVFNGLGVDYLIEGGQTMNPSTEDMLNAIEHVNADHIFIFPNNKNIILAANQAKALTKDKDIIVIPTKTVPQGITAVINYVPEKSVEDNEKDMTEEITRVKTGQITYAVRDTHIDDKEIHEGDIMGIGDHGMLAVGKEVAAVAKETVEQMVDDETELISIYYGEGFTEEEAEKLAGELEEQYDYCDVEVNCGGQPIYYCIISVE